MSDDVTELQEELAAARTEVERLQAMAADREARAAHLESQLGEARQELAQGREQAATAERELSERAAGLEAQVRDSASRYRELVLAQSPELPEELVAGETVAQIDDAVGRARETVAKVRGHIESQAQAGRVPVGAPVRSGPDYSALNAREKIAQGLQQRR